MKKENKDRICSVTKISEKEERILAKRALGGDNKAMDKLITSNMGFVINLAKEYLGNGVDMDDLVSEGCIAMMMAIRKWNPEQTDCLLRYAVWDIRKAMQQAVDKQGELIRIPDGELKNMKSMDAPLKQGHSRTLGESMTDNNKSAPSDIADRSSETEELLSRMQSLSERERVVMMKFYGIGSPELTMAEIGEGMGLKRERVRQIRKKAERKLRKIINRK